MTNKDLQTFDIRFPVAFGGGLAAALLFVAAWQQGTIASLLLAALSPLPIMIATLGFGHGAGLGAAVAATVTIMALIAAASTAGLSAKILLSAAISGLIFALGLTLPSWWLARLAGAGKSQVILPWLARVTGLSHRAALAAKPESSGRPVFYPFADILLSIAAIAFVIVMAVSGSLLLRHGSYEVGIAKAVARVEPLIVEMLGPHDLPKNLDLAQLSRLVIETIMPVMAAGLIVLALAANLWLCGRIVELSHRLPYPWPDIPHDLRVPRVIAAIFLICFGLAFLHDFAGLIARTAAAALGAIFVLQGLATVHDLSRGMKFRTTVLCGLYLALALLMPWPLIIFGAIGLIEAAFSLRDRKRLASKPI
jgi:hypothetical protein